MKRGSVVIEREKETPPKTKTGVNPSGPGRRPPKAPPHTPSKKR